MTDNKETSTAKESKETEELSKELENILDLQDMPQEEKHVVKRMMGMSMQMGGIISPQLELMKKMTPDHITEFLEGQREATRGQFKENRENKIFLGFIILVALIFIVILILLLRDNPDTMEKVIYAAGGFATGIIGGYGFGKTKNDN